MASRRYTCGLDAAMDVVGGKWKSLILWALHSEPRRFGQLRQLLPGISEKVLITHLRELVSAGVVHREVYPQTVLKVEYSLTPYGMRLFDSLRPLALWGQEHMNRQTAAESADENDTGRLSA
ncbi:helix-turn-helix domain-containing protein [Streptomyces sp. NPDC003077]|uniref:winged helix-turn-helix transcriptional regulator n=1 Tax=Streptomyces sp. NPDC003077 TaxID=3154443 RepID=UPI0033B6EA11